MAQNERRHTERLIKVRATPLRYITTARNQTLSGLAALDTLSRVWPDIPRTQELGALDVFLSHLRAEAVPSPSSFRKWQLDADFAHTSLGGVGQLWRLRTDPKVATYTRALLDALPGIIKWSQYIYCLAQAPVHFHTLIIVFRTLCIVPDILAAMVGAHDCVKLVTQLWIWEDHCQSMGHAIRATPAETLGIFLKSSTSSRKNDLRDRVIEASGGDAEFLVQLILRRIKKANKKLEIDAEVNVLVEHIGLLVGLCEQHPHSLRCALFNAGGLVTMTRTLAALPDGVGRDVSKSSAVRLFASCITFFLTFLEGDDYPSILLAVRAGFMDAFIEACPAFLHMGRDVTDMAMAIVRDKLPRYCVYRSFALQMMPFARKFKSSPDYEGLRKLPVINAAFVPMSTALAKRMSALEEEGLGRRCFNPQCQRVDIGKNFKQCGSCQVAYYCSLECQKADWNYSHRQLCKNFSLWNQIWGSRIKHDLSSIRFFAEWTAKLNFETFRAIAQRDFSDTPREQLFLYIDFTCVPETYSVQSMNNLTMDERMTGDALRSYCPESSAILKYRIKNGAEVQDMWGCARRDNFWAD
ncbi:hypothetical protein FB45DRAFT_1129618 [Roridomyces roridus]|uniref:MYND-type domain-containing protein n=1 Tax=Roridomyces roridus TaxID=1738132 RepID=A0AAD7B301_9AGAR|nr:hypothetical protein FB45DRAFT_1129618 [Roridomyces roridus]